MLFQNFIFVFIIAIVFSIATADFYSALLRKLKNPLLASAVLLLGMLLLIFAPIGYFFTKAAAFIATVDLSQTQDQVEGAFKYAQSYLATIPLAEQKINEVFGNIDTAAIGKKIFAFMGSFTQGSATFIIDAGFIAMFYFALNVYGARVINFILNATPVNQETSKAIISETSIVVKSVFFSLFITAFLQGALFGIFVYFLGLDALLMGLLYGFASMIPVIGGALVWIPTALYVYAYGSPVGAIALAIYAVVVLATVMDNFARPLIVKWLNKKVIKADAGLNEILLFFSMLAGVGQFGFFGIILGPAIVAMLISILKVFQKIEELKKEGA